MDKKTGGPAFPTIMRDADGYVSGRGHGMTLRDWFAGMALQGILAGTPDSICTIDEYANEAYQYADAMLEVRGKG